MGDIKDNWHKVRAPREIPPVPVTSLISKVPAELRVKFYGSSVSIFIDEVHRGEDVDFGQADSKRFNTEVMISRQGVRGIVREMVPERVRVYDEKTGADTAEKFVWGYKLRLGSRMLEPHEMMEVAELVQRHIKGNILDFLAKGRQQKFAKAVSLLSGNPGSVSR